MDIREFNTLEDALAAGFKVDLGRGQYGRLPTPTYDTRCYDLAEIFLADLPIATATVRVAKCDKLAAAIQAEIEAWLEHQQEPCDVCGRLRLERDHSDCDKLMF